MFKNIPVIMLAMCAGIATSSLQAATPTLTGVDVGTPSNPGSLETSTDASGKTVYTVTGGGSDIWNASDNFYYAYFKVTGNFDYVVKVASHIGNSGDGGWSKAELMARLDDGSGVPQGGDPFIANMATRPSSDTANSAPAGVNYRGPQWRAIRDNSCTWTAPNPAFPPNANSNWLRLERVGNVIYMYTSDDGKTWSMYSSHSPQGWDTSGSWPEGTDSPAVSVFTNAWPNTILLGLAVVAHNDADVSKVVFTDFGTYTPTSVAITTQPVATVSIAQNNALTLSVAATGDPVHYQWLKDGAPIAKAVTPTYKVALAQLSDAGKYKVRVFNGSSEVTSSESVVTVTVDTTAPTIVSYVPEASFTNIRLGFSEPVTDSALTASNYTIDQGITVSSVARVNATTVRLTVSKMGEGVNYNLTVNGIKDTALPANTIAADTKIAFKSCVFETGFASYERWDNANGDPGAIADIATAVANGTIRAADINSAVSQFGAPWGVADNYAARVSAYFVPPTSGDYVFFLSSDDQSYLYLSTDDKVANKKLIAQESGWSNQYQWQTIGGTSTIEEKRSDQFGNIEWPYGNQITLQAGKRYYIEILQDEGTGGDGADATFIKSGASDPSQDANGMFLKGSVIGNFLNPNGAKIDIATQPKSATIAQNTTTVLSIKATGASYYGTNVTYQWQKAAKGSTSFTDISGATSASYTTPLMALADDGTQFQVVCKVPTLTVTSTVAVISISNDTNPPTVASAGALKNTARVGVAFSELVDSATAQTAANYTISGATVSSAVLHYGKYVELTLAANITGTPNIVVKNVKDLAGNTMPQATLNIELVDMISADIGTPGTDPLQAGYACALGNGGYFVAGGGHDIWDSADGFHYVYQEFTGPFDMKARVEAMNPSGLSTWAKAELMVRESTAAGSRHSSVCVTRPAPAGVNNMEAQWRDTTDGSSGGATIMNPVPYPNAWIRLVREDVSNNVIKLYTSTDGVTWTLSNSHTTSGDVLPAKVLLGMAVTSHDNSGNDVLAEGLYQSFSIKTYQAISDPQLKIGKDTAGKVVITWAAGTLVSSPTVNGAYTPVAGATSPYFIAPTATTFYQVKQ